MAIDDNASYELTGYQVKDLAGKIRAKADSSSLASVATSGLYSDLTGAPTIPTVYNGTLTIQQNGTQLGTFSANQSSNTTINITGGGGGSTVTTFYYNETNGNLYEESSYTTPVVFSTVASAYTNGIVIINDDAYYSDLGFDGLTVVAMTDEGVFYCAMPGYENRFVEYKYTLNGNPVWEHSITTLQKQLTAGSNISISGDTISATDTTYSAFTGSTSSADGAAGLVPQPLIADTGKYLKGDGTWATVVPELVEMSYGESNAWAKFIAAYNAKCIVYCRASSNANPATGAKTRKAFMAYVNNETTPTQVEFQYYRSVSSHSASQQGDQVFVYVLKNDNSWSVTTREASSKIAVGTGLVSSYSSGTLTISADLMTGATSSTVGAAGMVPQPNSGEENKVLRGDGTWTGINDYSTSEVDTGSTWINGSHIYKKTINFGALPNATTKTVAHNITNLSRVIKYECLAYNSGSASNTPLPLVSVVGNNSTMDINATNIVMNTGVDRSAFDECYVTLYYTKSS